MSDVIVVKEDFNKDNFLDTRLYLTLHSPLEELLLSIPKTSLNGMFQKKSYRNDVIKDILKIINFSKTLEDRYKELDENSEEYNILREKSMLFCANMRNYLESLCKESSKFITDCNDSIKKLINSSDDELIKLKCIKQRYSSINTRLVSNEYNEHILSLSKKFESELSEIKNREFNFNCKRDDLSIKGKELQNMFLEYSKKLSKKEINNLKYYYETDFYGIEKDVSKLFGNYAEKWTDSLVY